jgi:hypothetical protein
MAKFIKFLIVLNLFFCLVGLAFSQVEHTPIINGMRVLYTEQINISNAADTNFVKTTTYVLPANTLTKVGDRVYVEMLGTGGAFASSKNYICNLGFTSWTAAGGFTGGVNQPSNATTTSSPQFVARGMFEYQTSSAQFSYGLSFVSGSGQSSNYVTSSAFSWTAAQNLACEGKDATGNAGAIVLREFRVWAEIV